MRDGERAATVLHTRATDAVERVFSEPVELAAAVRMPGPAVPAGRRVTEHASRSSGLCRCCPRIA